nr:MAG TPA: hypothetical protein [Caudoviricetes sp.]
MLYLRRYKRICLYRLYSYYQKRKKPSRQK